MESTKLPDVLEQCNSEDSTERFEAFEELWAHIFNQGTPSPDASAVFLVLLDWIRTGHPDWVDILDGICGCAFDLTDGPTRAQDENSRRIELLKTIVGGHDVFEEVLERPCAIGQGICLSHSAAGDLLRIVLPDRSEWLASVLIELIRKKPTNHMRLWEVVGRLAAFDGLSGEDLHLCAEQTNIEPIRRSALFYLSSRGDQAGIDGLRRSVNALVLPLFAPTVEEATLVVRKPENIPFDLLMDLYRRAVDLRAAHDLACGVLRKAAADDRSGWELVSEKRVGGRLVIRHPDVPPPRNQNAGAEVISYRDDLLRKSRLSLVDTDIWALFGLATP